MEINLFKQPVINQYSNFLLIIAHPDDEVLFFSPFLLLCQKNKCEVSVLCLSCGNYYGKGEMRSEELMHSVANYAIHRSKVMIIEDPDLQDGPLNRWSPEIIQKYINKAIYKYKSTDIVTFDETGVSGH